MMNIVSLLFRKPRILPIKTLLTVVFVIAMLNSCSLKKSTVELPMEPPDSFSVSGNDSIPDHWWTSFNDSALNAAIDTAMSTNFNLKTTWYRLVEARKVVDRESASLFPEIFASLRGETGSGQTAFEVNDNMWLGLTADYELDLWGRIRYGIEAEEYRMEASLNDFRTAALTLSAELTLAWYRLAEARHQLEIAHEQAETNEKVLELIRARYTGGQTRSVDIFRQEQLLEASRERVIFRETQVRLYKHQLAVLSGKPPRDSAVATDINIPKLPPLPETGLPVELVKRRPDIQSALFRLYAADMDLASAMSARYPRISFTAQLSTSGNVDQLFRDWAWSFSGNLLAPLFYGGELQAEADRNEAVKNQRLFEYGQRVLIAFREVEDALIRELKQRESMASIKKQHELAEISYEQLRVSYFNGMSDYLDVLTALEQEQQLRRDLLTAKLELIEYRVALYRALAGGFEPDISFTNILNQTDE